MQSLRQLHPPTKGSGGKGVRCKVNRRVRAAGVGRRNLGPEARVITDATMEDSDMEHRGWRERVGTVLL